MKKTRNLLCLLILGAAMIGPAHAAADEVPTTSSSSDTAPLTLDPEEIQALTDAGADTSSDDDKNTFEKASDFVTDNAPWFIIGIIVLAAIVAGILIMRGRPRKAKGEKYKTPRASKSNKAKRKAGGAPGMVATEQPAQVPSASELRRRKRAAIQRSREEERLRRKAGIEGRKAARQGGVPAPAAPAAVTAAGVAATGGLDPVEAEKQSARDQETAAAAMARFGGGAVPAPTSPSQTAPAAGVVTSDVPPQEGVYAEQPMEPEPVYEPAPEAEPYYEVAPPVTDPVDAPAAPPVSYADTNVIHEPAIEAPGPDAAVGNAAQAFLAGGAAGAAGGLAAARGAGQASEPEELEPVIAPEPGMTAEHALEVDPETVAAEPDPEPETVAPAPEQAPLAPLDGDDRLRATAAEIRATQEPAAPEPPAEPAGVPETPPGLAAVERRLSENSEERDRALRDAEERLRRVEQRAEDAEKRAAFAERLAQLKVEESERERRLNDVVSGIDRAEHRALEAEARAEAAERAAAAALEQSDLKVPESTPAPSTPPPAPPVREPETAYPSEPEPLAPDVPSVPERKGLFGNAPSASAGPSDAINLNSATFEELREAGLSVTQATRILAYRERFGGYNAVEDLEKVPGFPPDLIESLRGRVTI